MKINLNLISLDPNQPRQESKSKADFQESLVSLGQSIVSGGLQNPIHVRRHPENPDRYMVVNGECRFRAHTVTPELSDIGTIDAILMDFTGGESEVMESQIVDNEVRNDILPMESARSWQRAITAGSSVERLASKLGKPESFIRRRLELTALPMKIQEAIDCGKASQEVAHHILALFKGDQTRQSKAWEKCEGKGTSKRMKAIISAYSEEVMKSRSTIFDEPASTIPKDDFKAAENMLKRLESFVLEFEGHKFGNGSGPVFIKAIAKQKKLGNLKMAIAGIERVFMQKLSSELLQYEAATGRL